MIHEKCISSKPGVLRNRDQIELAHGRKGGLLGGCRGNAGVSYRIRDRNVVGPMESLKAGKQIVTGILSLLHLPAHFLHPSTSLPFPFFPSCLSLSFPPSPPYLFLPLASSAFLVHAVNQIWLPHSFQVNWPYPRDSLQIRCGRARLILFQNGSRGHSSGGG